MFAIVYRTRTSRLEVVDEDEGDQTNPTFLDRSEVSLPTTMDYFLVEIVIGSVRRG